MDVNNNSPKFVTEDNDDENYIRKLSMGTYITKVTTQDREWQEWDVSFSTSNINLVMFET